MKKVLTIAGSDSGGGAGIQADLKTMTAHKTYGASVITAVTAQNTLGVQAVNTLSPEFVAEQIDSVLSDIKIQAAKTGMLASKEIVKVTAGKCREYGIKNLVVDPVMVATSGDLLLEREAVDTYKEELIPEARIITPNINEAKILAGKEVEDDVAPETLARVLYKLGSDYVLIKGGHGSQGREIIDLLYDGSDLCEIKGERIKTPHTHGTGCTLSAAIASFLAHDYKMKEAVKRSKIFVTEAIRSGIDIGEGNNPLNHLAFFENENLKGV